MGNILMKIESIRKQKGISRRELAMGAGINVGSLQSAVKRGSNISVDTALRLTRALGVSLNDLIEDYVQGKQAEVAFAEKIFICSPYRGDTKLNKAKALAYCRRATAAGYMPMAPHLYFTLFLDEEDPDQRMAGIAAGLECMEDCAAVWVFGEPTEGMRIEIAHAVELGKSVVFYDAD